MSDKFLDVPGILYLLFVILSPFKYHEDISNSKRASSQKLMFGTYIVSMEGFGWLVVLGLTAL